MARFNLSLQDLMSPDPTPFTREQNKSLPTGKPLVTSGSYGQTNVFAPNVGASTLSISQMAMGIPLTEPAANVTSNINQSMSMLLQAAQSSPAVQSDHSAAIGIIKGLVPSDIASAASNNASNSVATATNTPDPVMGTQIATNPLFNAVSTAGGAQVTADLQAGNISPNVMYVLNLIMTHGISITLSAGRSGSDGIVGTGYGKNTTDLHYMGQAIDIAYFGPPSSSEKIGAPIGPITKRVIDLVSSITGPRAPTMFLGPVNYGKCTMNASYIGALCIGNSSWDVPPPPSATTSGSNASGSSGTGTSGAASLGGSAKAQQVVATAISQTGVPYSYGAEDPNVAFDCSGLTQYCYATAGITIPRVAQDQYNAGPVVNGALVPGDLVFFSSDTTTKSISHVGIYIGYGNQMIDAPHTGAVVRQETFASNYGDSWGSEFYVGATRPAP